MSETVSRVDQDRALLQAAQQRGGLSKWGAYVRLSGPGWLQSAMTLGGGTLVSSLYLGVLAGVTLLWLQPFAMILGIIMLSAIGFVTLSTGERPFRAINHHVNPVLGWSWLAASMAANLVWCMGQYALCYGVIEQNLLPGLFKKQVTEMVDGVSTVVAPAGILANDAGPWVVSGVILLVATIITWSYGSGHWGVKVYEWTLKLIVAMIVLCFFGVVYKLNVSGELDWGAIWAGFIPDWRQLSQPAASLQPLIDAIADPAAHAYWTGHLVSEQRNVMISAAATAVGINMTFLLPYSMLARGWDRHFRGLAIFDLATGMLIPFMLATSCVVIASANQFHGKMPAGFVVEADQVVPIESETKNFNDLITKRNEALGAEASPPSLAEQQLAASLLKRDAFALASSLELLTGPWVANLVFGLGVVAMTLSTITLMMLISGFIVCEVLNVPSTGWPLRFGSLAAVTGALWPLLWTGEVRAYLVIVASVFAMALLPLAYVTFFFLMNQKSLLGDDMPRGPTRVVWNVLMLVASVVAAGASVYVIWSGYRWGGLAAIAGLLVLVAIFQPRSKQPATAG